MFNKEMVHSVITIVINKIGKERFNKHKKGIITVIVIIVLACVCAAGRYVINKISNKAEDIQTAYTATITEIIPNNTIYFSEFGDDNFTCTGLTYDEEDKSYWIADYGSYSMENEPLPRIVEVNAELTSVIKSINLIDELEGGSNLQGLCYDKKDNALWCAVGKSIIEFDKNGTLIKSINLGKYSKYLANGICYGTEDDSLWVICASKYILHYDKDGNVLQEIDFNYADQDHIVKQGNDLLVTVGADYRGTNNFVCRLSTEDGSIKALYRVNGSNSVEGICINDEKVLIANDGLYHSDMKGESYISVYNEKDFDTSTLK